MSKTKEASRGKGRRKALPVLGAAGLSLSLAGGAQAAIGGMTNVPARVGAIGHEITLCEEELSDISLATFHVFDKEGAPLLRTAGGCACACATGGDFYSNQPANGGPGFATRPRSVQSPQQPYHAPKHPQVPANQSASPRPRPQPETHSTATQRASAPTQSDAAGPTLHQSTSQQGEPEVPGPQMTNSPN